MRSLFIAAVMSLLLLPLQQVNAEQISEAHAMFYYQVPLGAVKAKQKQHSFGFRMDRVDFDAGQMVDQQSLLSRPAVFDFKMSSKGVQGIYTSGNNLLEKYKVNRADGEGSSLPTLSEMLDDMPVGVFMGICIGIVIISGVGG